MVFLIHNWFLSQKTKNFGDLSSFGEFSIKTDLQEFLGLLPLTMY